MGVWDVGGSVGWVVDLAGVGGRGSVNTLMCALSPAVKKIEVPSSENWIIERHQLAEIVRESEMGAYRK